MRKLISGHRLIGPGPGDPWQELAVAVLLRAVPGLADRSGGGDLVAGSW